MRIDISAATWLRINEECNDGVLHNMGIIEKADEMINDILDDLEEPRD